MYVKENKQQIIPIIGASNLKAEIKTNGPINSKINLMVVSKVNSKRLNSGILVLINSNLISFSTSKKQYIIMVKRAVIRFR